MMGPLQPGFLPPPHGFIQQMQPGGEFVGQGMPFIPNFKLMPRPEPYPAQAEPEAQEAAPPEQEIKRDNEAPETY